MFGLGLKLGSGRGRGAPPAPGALSGTMQTGFGAGGALTVARELAGEAGGIGFDASGNFDIAGVADLAGEAGIGFAAAGGVAVTRAFAGNAATGFGASGALAVTRAIAGGAGIGSAASANLTTEGAGTWLLASGSWDDLGVWDDTATWPAAPAPASAIETSAPDAWWRADSGVTTASPVSAWLDKRAGARSVVQANATLQPVYSATSVGGEDGIAFDGTDDRLRLLDNPIPIGSNDFSFACVYRATVDLSGFLFAQRDLSDEGFEVGGGGTNGRMHFNIENTAGTVVSRVSNQSSVPLLFNGTPNVIVGRVDRDGNLEVWTNGGKLVWFTSDSVAAAAGDIHLSDTPIYIGARGNTTTTVQNPANATIADVIIWNNKLLTNQEINDIGDELATRYGVTFTGPV